jgi:hypothetical protein
LQAGIGAFSSTHPENAITDAHTTMAIKPAIVFLLIFFSPFLLYIKYNYLLLNLGHGFTLIYADLF